MNLLTRKWRQYLLQRSVKINLKRFFIAFVTKYGDIKQNLSENCRALKKGFVLDMILTVPIYKALPWHHTLALQSGSPDRPNQRPAGTGQPLLFMLPQFATSANQKHKKCCYISQSKTKTKNFVTSANQKHKK